MMILDASEKLAEGKRAWSRFFAIAKTTIGHGGGTFRPDTGAEVRHDNGYIVGTGKVYDGDLESRTYPVILNVIAGILAEVWPRDTRGVQYIGTEYVDGGLCVDTVAHYPAHYPGTLFYVATVARRNNERAIWDCARGASVETRELCNLDGSVSRTLCDKYEYHNRYTR